jgi:rifampicin phosphotransferase
MVVNVRYVLHLPELTRAHTPRAGVKAANLGELLSAGFDVPGGFVLAVEAFERFLGLHGFGASAPADEVADAPLPDDVAEELVAAHASVRDELLAVRSSGVAEDLAGASFAGQYETLLGVSGEADLLRAVRRCWSSAFSDRVRVYRRGRVDGEVPPMAVLVQRLVQPTAAGVAFSADPVTGDREAVVISAVRGLGERLVSGEAQPDEWSVRHGQAECRSAREGAIGVAEAMRIAELARRVEMHFGTAQDIEWALAGPDLFLLQARPVTALPAPAAEQVAVPVDVPEGSWQREVTHFPRPISRMIAGYLEAHNAAFREMFATYGLLLEGVEAREIGGWVYARVVPLGGRDRPMPPAWVMWLATRTLPSLRRRIAACREAFREDRAGRDIERWYAEWQPQLAAQLRELADVDLPGLSDEELDAHLAVLDDLVKHSLRIHFLLHGAMLMVLAELAFACRDLLGWDDRRTLALMSGLSVRSTEPSLRLAELARIAADSPAVRPMLDHLEKWTAADACAADPVFAEAFASYLRYYGCRALGMEFVEPTLAEMPDLVLRLVRDQVLRGYDPGTDEAALAAEREEALAEALSRLGGRPGDTARFQRALARAERAYPVREDSEFYTASAPLGVGRYAAIEVGSRLAARGQIPERDDVFLLDLSEQRVALASGASCTEQVGRRRAELAWIEAHPGPTSYGPVVEAEPPATRVLPEPVRFAMDAVQWVMLDRILAPKESGRVQAGGDTISGIAAAQGVYAGPARVVMDETDFGKVRPGDVLVCPITSPVWSVLFPSIGGLITDTGGVLSHAAIIAREYRLPAVVGTGNATSLLVDGQLVTIDGGRGTVQVGSLPDATTPQVLARPAAEPGEGRGTSHEAGAAYA